MNATGLKFQSIIPLAVLLTIGMILVDVVVVVFWQRDMVRAEVNRAQAVLRVWNEGTPSRSLQSQSLVRHSLRKLCRAEGSSCKDILFYRNEIISLNGVTPARLHERLHQVAVSGKPYVTVQGVVWRWYGPSKTSLFVSIPLIKEAMQPASIGVLIDLRPMYERIGRQQDYVLVYILVNVLLLTVVGLFRMFTLVIRPIDKMVEISEEYDESKEEWFSFGMDRNELGKLSLALNRMLTRIKSDRERLRSTITSLEIANDQLQKSQKEMVRTEKLAAVGRLAAGLSHEIGNPLGIIQGYLNLLEDDTLTTDERMQFSNRASSELNRISVLVRQLLNLARSPSEGDEVIDVCAIFSEMQDIFTTQKSLGDIEIVSQCEQQGGTVKMDPAAFRQVMLNCLLNAVDAIKARSDVAVGRIAMSCSTERRAGEETVVLIRIEDDGIGIAQDQLDIIFDPFYTTKEPGQGTGLGLSVSAMTVEAAGGKIRAESIKDTGTTIIIELPLA